MRGSLRDRFEDKYVPEPNSGCWLWTAACNNRGYGVIGIAGNSIALAHRVSYELFVGPIPKELDILHKCDTPLCVNPDHLRLGTQADNNRDKAYKDRGSRSGLGLLRGVLRIPNCPHRPYMAQCRIGGKVRCSGYYATQEEAHAEYVRMRDEQKLLLEHSEVR